MEFKMEEEEKNKKVKKNRGRFGIRIVAAILALLMVFSVTISLIYYLLNM